MELNNKSISHELTVPEDWIRDMNICESSWLWEIDANACYTYCSDNVEKLLGFPSEQIIGKTPFDFMDNNEALRVSSLFSDISHRNLPITNLVNWNIMQNGRPVCFLTNGSPFYNKTGNVSGYRGSAKDITESRPLIDEIQRLKIELKDKTEQLDAMVVAYNVMLEKNNPHQTEKKIVSNMNEMILPCLEKLKKEKLTKRQVHYLTEIETQLKEITAPFYHNLNTHFANLTPSEIKVAGLIKQGKTTKDIANFLDSSIDAVKFHRYNLRKKLGIKNKKVSIRVYLQKIEEG